MTRDCPCPVPELHERVERLRERRLGEDERLVCMERAQILAASGKRHAHLPRAPRQAAIIRDLCEQTTPVIEPEDILLGRVPELLPDAEGEAFVAAHPELFEEPGLPGRLDSLSIFIPDWDWLLAAGLGGIAEQAQANMAGADETGREFLASAVGAIGAVSTLIRRYAAAGRVAGLAAAAERCDRVAWEPPATLLDALQLLQIVHMVLSVLIGGRDVTPGRMDQYLLPLYRRDLAEGRLARDEAVALLAMFMLRLTQAAGNDTDFDDNTRRSPCRYSHLYVTVGGGDAVGEPADSDLSLAILDAVHLLAYKEPTAVVRYRDDLGAGLKWRVAELVVARRPVTIYNDAVVLRALAHQGVPPDIAWNYAHSACHNVLVPGHDAGSGPNFHNLPAMLLRALDRAGSVTFDAFMALLTEEMRVGLQAARRSAEWRWEHELKDACPLLQSALMRHSVERARPCWQSADISHLNHSAMGLATTVDSLIAIRELASGPEAEMTLGELHAILKADWLGHEALRQRVRTELPRYGRDDPLAAGVARRVGEMWVREVERAGEGMERLRMWPAFYSHMVHAREGCSTGATPDGRRSGEPLSQNQSPSVVTLGCSPTSVLRAMADLPVEHTPSGASTLTLSPRDVSPERLLGMLETYFGIGGLHLHVTVVDPGTLRAAIREPQRHPDLMVRVAGFSAYFVRLAPYVQEDVLSRYLA